MSSTFPKQAIDLNGAGTSLSAALAGAILGGGGAGVYSSRATGDADESPEQRKQRIMRSIAMGAGFGGAAGMAIPAGVRMLRDDDRPTYKKILTSPVSTAVRHPFTSAGAIGSWYASQHAKDRVRHSLKDLIRTTGSKEPLVIPKHLSNPEVGKEQAAFNMLKKLISDKTERQHPAEVDLLARAAQGKGILNWKDVLQAVKFWQRPQSGEAASRLGAVTKILANTPVKSKLIPSVSALALLGLSGAPLAGGYLTDRSIRG